MLLIISLTLFLSPYFDENIRVASVITVLGMSMFFVTLGTTFLLLTVIELFPLTVSTLATSLVFACYCAGSVASGGLGFELGSDHGVFEALLEICGVLLFHVLAFKETRDTSLPYQLE